MTTSTNAQPAGQPAPGPGNYVVDDEEQARKRQELNLSPHRDTAPRVVQRPPDERADWPQWLLVGSLSLLLVAAGLLLLGQVLTTMPGMPVFTWQIPWPSAASSQAPAQMPAYVLQQPGLTLWWGSDFERGDPDLPAYDAPGEFAAETLPQEGVYRMTVYPGKLGWTLFDVSALPAYRLEAKAVISAASPLGQAGLLARYQDRQNFYQFTINGERQFDAFVWREGVPSRIAVKENDPNIFGAGQANVISLEDRGDRLDIFVNNVLIFGFPLADAAAGRPGIAAVGNGDAVTTVDFDWVTLYAVDPQLR